MRKIFSFLSISNASGENFKFPSIKPLADDSDIKLDDISVKHLGFNPATNEQFFSYDVEHTLFPDEEYDEIYQFHVYDNEVEEDFNTLKDLLKNSSEFRRNIQEIGDKEFGIRPLYKWLLAIVDNDEETIKLLRNIEKLQDDYLKSLGFAGLTQFYQ